MKVAAIQLNAGQDRAANVENALRLVDQAAQQGAGLVALPEYVTYLGDYEGFAAASETLPGDTYRPFAEKAAQQSIYLHCGSLIEKSSHPDRFYNTSLLFDPEGRLVARYRKIHLFDVDVPSGVTDNESSKILPGEELVIVRLPEITIGMSICYDLRFPELYRELASAGAELLAIPSAFARHTGEAHWRVLLRARAIENLAYVLAPSQYGEAGESKLFGHAMIVDPWGTVLAEGESVGDQIVMAEIDQDIVRTRRQQIPVLEQRRPDLYPQPVVEGNLGDLQ